MDTQKIDASKISGMVMCGDHPSFTKTALNAQESSSEKDIGKEEKKFPIYYGRITPSQSRAGALPVTASSAAAAVERACPLPPRHTLPAVRSQAHLLQAAALGAVRWPPYLVCVWVAALVLGHVLHALAAALARALPHVRDSCHYFRQCTEECWSVGPSRGARAALLAAATGAAYALYGAAYVLHALALWAVEPLGDGDDATGGHATADCGHDTSDKL